jgi:hypothetical protein
VSTLCSFEPILFSCINPSLRPCCAPTSEQEEQGRHEVPEQSSKQGQTPLLFAFESLGRKYCCATWKRAFKFCGAQHHLLKVVKSLVLLSHRLVHNLHVEQQLQHNHSIDCLYAGT